MADPFIGEVRIFAFDFAPSGWALCDGRELTVAQNNTLFTIIGTAYGAASAGNFKLPNIIDRVVIGTGQGPALTNRTLGESGGQAEVTLLTQEMPLHTHVINANVTAPGDINVPGPSSALAVSTGGTLYQAASTGTMAPGALGFAGASAAHNNMQPSLNLFFCIALTGVYPID